jgi:N-acetylglucosamine-6-phosphate deacetylase
LTDEDLYTEVIADGVHVSDEMVRLILRSRPAKKIILISDGLFITGCAKKGDIVKLGGLQVRAADDGSLRLLDGTLAGSNTTLPQIVDRVIAMKAAPAKDILAMATTNPLEMLGLRMPR